MQAVEPFPCCGLILAESRRLRLLTLFLFYFSQGIPVGVFLVAIPSWMAAGGASSGDTAWVVGAAFVPWTLKLVHGFLIDRYAYLPMGRRRAWIIAAQLGIALAFLAGSAAAPQADDVVVLAIVAFGASLSVAVQDVAIDGLAIDILREDERPKASGIMFGAQMLGVSSATALIGSLLDTSDFRTAMASAAILPALVALFGLTIRERAGERRLPWSAGQAHPLNFPVQADAWLPMLKESVAAMVAPLCLMLVPIMLLRTMPFGAFDAFHPVFAAQALGWSIAEYTSKTASAQFAAAIAALTLGAWFGSRKSLVAVAATGAAAFLLMASWPSLRTDDRFFTGMIFVFEFLEVFLAVSIVPVCMQACSPIVAATQFTLFMTLSNIGRLAGATLAGLTAGEDQPAMMYAVLALAYGLIMVLVANLPLGARKGSDRSSFRVSAPLGE